MKLFKIKKKSKLEKNKDKALFICAICWLICALILYVTSKNNLNDFCLYLSGLFLCAGILYLILAYKYKK